MSINKLFLPGFQFETKSVESAVLSLSSHWRFSLHETPSGEFGWYRRLDDLNRVGNVATAQGLLSSQELGIELKDIEKIIATLTSRVHDDGGWSFISSLDFISVVDSTSFVVRALFYYQNASKFRSYNLSKIIERGLDWIENAVLPSGGWAITATGPQRVVSTALALETLVGCGRGSSKLFRRGVQSLINSSDPHTGAWHDASNRLSVPVTAKAISCLSLISTTLPDFDISLSRPCNWIISLSLQTDLWCKGPECPTNEEVEIQSARGIIRIDYGHSTLPLVEYSLMRSNHKITPLVASSLNRLICCVTKADWGMLSQGRAHALTSWMLYDITKALKQIQVMYPKDIETIWYDNNKIILHPARRPKLIRIIVQSRMIAILIFIVISGMIVLRAMGFQIDFGGAVLTAIIGPILLNIVSNFMYDRFRRH